MAKSLRFILGDQLSPDMSSLAGADSELDVVLLCEVAAEATYVPHHPQKIAFLFSAMRHFAAELEERGFTVDYVRLDSNGNTGSFRGEAARAVARHRPERLIVSHPGEWRVFADMQHWEAEFGIPVEIREDNRFFCTLGEFRRYAEGRQNLVMEFFYRDMRKRTGLLMDAFGEPEGGQWNFDKDNRRSLPGVIALPDEFIEEPDEVTREVLELVGRRFGHHFGALEPFRFAVTRAGAERA
jgi:deoxyribodipyrimidine photolyase-related protein